MKAPVTAYVIKDNNFYKTCLKKGGTDYLLYVARFLTSYSSTPEEMAARIMDIFRLDKLYYHGEKQADGSVKPIGFIGAVRVGGANAEYHAQKRMSGVRSNGGDGSVYEILNDAGLNIKPRVSVEALGQWANWMRFRVYVYGGPYGTVDSGSYTSEYFGLSGSLETAKAGEEKMTVFDFTDPTDSPAMTGDGSLRYDEGYNVSLSAQATNEEGTTQASVSFVAKARVRNPRQYFLTSQDEPSYPSDLSGDVGADMYEDDWSAMAGLGEGTVSGAGIVMYQSPGGSTPPEMTSPLPAGWYFATVFEPKCFHVASGGLIDRVKTLIPDTPSRIGIYLYFCTDRDTQDSDYPCWGLSYEAVTDYEWTSHDAIRITIRGSEASATAPLKTGIALRTSQTAGEGAFDSNLTADDTEIVLTLVKTGVTDITKKNESVLRGIYRSESDMHADTSPTNSGKWLDASSRGSMQYSSVRESAVTVQWRRTIGKVWEDVGTFFNIDCVISQFDTSRIV